MESRRIDISGICIDLSACVDMTDGSQSDHFTMHGQVSETRINDRRWGCENCGDKAAIEGINEIYQMGSQNSRQETATEGINKNDQIDLNDCSIGSTFEDDRPKRTRLISDIMRDSHEEGVCSSNKVVVRRGTTSKKRGRRGRKTKPHMDENHGHADMNFQSEEDKVQIQNIEGNVETTEASFVSSSHHYENPLPFPLPFQEGTSRSQLNIGEGSGSISIEDPNIPSTYIQENSGATNNVVEPEEDAILEVAEILTNNLHEGSPPDVEDVSGSI